ncbi:MAG: sigma-70 RNA polymerase sigma factor region 4 domain-containing protein [Planctomycetota bacterium]
MSTADTTCWTMIRGAAEGRAQDREEFARRYERLIRTSLRGRWKGSHLVAEVDDAVQDVFLDCFREGGALAKANPRLGHSFRAFLHGVVMNVARRFERARARAGLPLDSDLELPSREAAFSSLFDRAWAEALMRQAAVLQTVRAREVGPDADRRVELLRLRFRKDLPIREIAERWDADPAHVHHEYAKAREEFHQALHDVVQEHQGGTHGEVERECERLVACFA